VARNNPYFSVVPSKAAGLTDQLNQFRVFYKLGQSLGYTYWHRPFLNRRTILAERRDAHTHSPSYPKRLLELQTLFGLQQKPPTPPASVSDVYDFIGFNEHFLAKNEQLGLGEPNVIDMKLGDDLLERLDITDLTGLQGFVRGRVAETDASTRAPLVEFALFGTRAFFGLVNAEIPDHPTDLDLRTIYSEKRSTHPWPSLFRRGAIKTLLHIRQGDTAALETPWHTVISQWPREYRFTEYARFDDIPVRNRVLRVEDFHRFFKKFISCIDDPVSTLLFSDGFKSSLRRLNRHGGKQGLTPQQLRALNKAVESFDKTKFGPFKDLENCDLFIGEEPEKLCHLIHSFLQADLIITGPQGGMIPKLIGHYCDVENMPLVLVLSRSDELMSRVFGGLNRTGKVVFVNISQPDYGGLATRVNDLLAANRVTAPEYLTAKGKSERRGLTPTTPRDNPVM
jgi:hypothetical protein